MCISRRVTAGRSCLRQTDRREWRLRVVVVITGSVVAVVLGLLTCMRSGFGGGLAAAPFAACRLGQPAGSPRGVASWRRVEAAVNERPTSSRISKGSCRCLLVDWLALWKKQQSQQRQPSIRGVDALRGMAVDCQPGGCAFGSCCVGACSRRAATPNHGRVAAVPDLPAAPSARRSPLPAGRYLMGDPAGSERTRP